MYRATIAPHISSKNHTNDDKSRCIWTLQNDLMNDALSVFRWNGLILVSAFQGRKAHVTSDLVFHSHSLLIGNRGLEVSCRSSKRLQLNAWNKTCWCCTVRTSSKKCQKCFEELSSGFSIFHDVREDFASMMKIAWGRKKKQHCWEVKQGRELLMTGRYTYLETLDSLRFSMRNQKIPGGKNDQKHIIKTGRRTFCTCFLKPEQPERTSWSQDDS